MPNPVFEYHEFVILFFLFVKYDFKSFSIQFELVVKQLLYRQFAIRYKRFKFIRFMSLTIKILYGLPEFESQHQFYYHITL